MRREDVRERLKENGYVVLPDYLDDGKIKTFFFEEVQEVIDNSIDEAYKFGKAERIGSLGENYKKRRAIFYSFTTPLLRQIKEDIFGDDCDFTEIFVTHEFTNDNGLERNGYLHFDRIWTFKYFYYITDVMSAADGPLTVVPGSHVAGKEMRESQVGRPYEEQRNRIEVDYPALYEEVKGNLFPIYGTAGTLIMFDTDVFHMGGKIERGHERKVCRLHMR